MSEITVTGYLNNIKKVHKNAKEGVSGFNVLEFKVESREAAKFDQITKLDSCKVVVTLEPDQTELEL